MLRCYMLGISNINFFNEVYDMAISYNKLWKLLIDNKMTKTDLKNATQTSSYTITKLGHDEPVSLDFLVKVCKVFHCDIGDIMEVVLEED